MYLKGFAMKLKLATFVNGDGGFVVRYKEETVISYLIFKDGEDLSLLGKKNLTSPERRLNC